MRRTICGLRNLTNRLTNSVTVTPLPILKPSTSQEFENVFRFGEHCGEHYPDFRNSTFSTSLPTSSIPLEPRFSRDFKSVFKFGEHLGGQYARNFDLFSTLFISRANLQKKIERRVPRLSRRIRHSLTQLTGNNHLDSLPPCAHAPRPHFPPS